MNKWCSVVLLSATLTVAGCSIQPKSAEPMAAASVHVAKVSSRPLLVLSSYLGKYPHDGMNYLKEGVLHERL